MLHRALKVMDWNAKWLPRVTPTSLRAAKMQLVLGRTQVTNVSVIQALLAMVIYAKVIIILIIKHEESYSSPTYDLHFSFL